MNYVPTLSTTMQGKEAMRERILRRTLGECFEGACPKCRHDQVETVGGRLCVECGYLIPVPMFPERAFDAPVSYHPGIRVTKGMRVRLPGGGLFQVLSVVDDDEDNPCVVELNLEPVPDDDGYHNG